MRLKELRKEKGLSQLRLATDLHTTQNTISRYETGEREPGIAELIAALRRAQDDFNVAKDQQTERAASDDAPSATSLRKNLIVKVNDRLIPYLNAMAIENEIGRANDTVSRRKSSK